MMWSEQAKAIAGLPVDGPEAQHLHPGHRQRRPVPAATQDVDRQEALFAYCAELTGRPLT